MSLFAGVECDMECYAMEKEIKTLKQEIERLREAQRWIPVTERLPERGKTVLAYICHDPAVYGRDDGFRAYRVYEYDGHFVGMGNLCAVTHWMPLPAAPEEGEL